MEKNSDSQAFVPDNERFPRYVKVVPVDETNARVVWKAVRLFLPDGSDGTGFGTASNVKREDAKRENKT